MTAQYGTRVDAPIVAGNDDTDDIASAINSQIQGGLKLFATESAMKAWSTAFKSRVFGTVAFVLQNAADQEPQAFQWDGKQKDGSDGKWVDFELGTQDLPTAGIGFVKPDGSTLTGIELLALNGLEITGTEKDGFTLTVTGGGGMTFEERVNYALYKGIKDVFVGPGLELNALSNSQNGPVTGVEIGVKPGLYEHAKSPAMLAYIKEDTEVIGRSSHRAGTVWFDDVIVPSGPYIGAEMDTKSFSIEEADGKDPNVTGGTSYLIALRAAMKGTAPDDGYVRIYLYNSSIDPFDPKGYVEDDNGQPMVVERHYKSGEKLDVLELLGVVTAKAMQAFTCHLVHNFTSDNVVLCDPVEGITALMIQAITSNSSTGDALQQYELDTQDDIVFAKHYLGPDRATMKYLVMGSQAEIDVAAGQSGKQADGWTSYAIGPVKSQIMSGHYMITDNGRDIADFTLGKVFSAEETQMMKGKDIDVSVTLADKDNAYNVVVMKWTGAPDAYTSDIFKSRNNEMPNWSPNWSVVGTLFISEDVVVGDHTLAKTFTLPSDMVNYGVFIYPVSAQQPMTCKLKELNVSVNPPFIGVALKETKKFNEKHLYFSNLYKSFSQNRQGFYSLRYTINDSEQPAPCGEPGKGAADITIDKSVNQVTGSQALGGEGALEFQSDGQATITTQVRLWSEKAAGTKSTVKFWWAKVVGDTFEKLDDSEGTFEIIGGTKSALYRLPTANIQIESGDRLALRMQGNSKDSAYLQCMDDSKPLVSVNVTFKELSGAS